MIEAGDLKRGAALRNVCERAKTAVAIPCYADAAIATSARLIDEELRAANLTISPDARDALVPLLGGDRRASRAELRKLTLYAHGQERIEIDDVMAVVADASALGARGAGRCGVRRTDRRRREGVRQGDRSPARRRSRSSARRCARSSGCIRCGSTSRAARRRPRWSRVQPPIHFRRKPLVEAALKSWTSERLVKAMAMLAEASLDARLQSDLAETIAQRALTTIARSAAQRG